MVFVGGYEERLRNAPGLAEVLVILKEASAARSQGSPGSVCDKSCAMNPSKPQVVYFF